MGVCACNWAGGSLKKGTQIVINNEFQENNQHEGKDWDYVFDFSRRMHRVYITSASADPYKSGILNEPHPKGADLTKIEDYELEQFMTEFLGACAQRIVEAFFGYKVDWSIYKRGSIVVYCDCLQANIEIKCVAYGNNLHVSLTKNLKDGKPTKIPDSFKDIKWFMLFKKVKIDEQGKYAIFEFRGYCPIGEAFVRKSNGDFKHARKTDYNWMLDVPGYKLQAERRGNK